MRINHRFSDTLNEYKVYRYESGRDSKGRVIKNNSKLMGSILGTLSTTSQREKERYKQLGHDCSHKIVTQNITDIKAGDVLFLEKGPISDKNRKFTVVDKRNPASLDFWEVIGVNEVMNND